MQGSIPISTFICTLPNVTLHYFYSSSKVCVDMGQLVLFSTTNYLYLTLSLNKHLIQIFTDTVFYRVKYDNKTVSYITQSVQGGFYVVSFEEGSQGQKEWQGVWEEMAEVKGFRGIEDIRQVKGIDKRKIQYHCKGIEKEPVSTFNKITLAKKFKERLMNVFKLTFKR